MADLELHDDEGNTYSFDNIMTQGWLEGHRPGLERAATYLRDQAVEEFKRGNDNAARALRDLANKMETTLGKEMDDRAAQHAKDYPDAKPGATVAPKAAGSRKR